MLASFSFAFISTFTREKSTRIIFTVFLGVVTVLALSSSITDSIALDNVRGECRKEKCTTAIPEDLGSEIQKEQDLLKCKCTPDAWFWVTLAMDFILTISALVCLGITVVPWLGFGRGGESRREGLGVESF